MCKKFDNNLRKIKRLMFWKRSIDELPKTLNPFYFKEKKDAHEKSLYLLHTYIIYIYVYVKYIGIC